jgi:hypothetical protein
MAVLVMTSLSKNILLVILFHEILKLFLPVKMTVLWDIAPCSLVEVYRRFRGAYCLHHQGDHRPDNGSSTHL